MGSRYSEIGAASIVLEQRTVERFKTMNALQLRFSELTGSPLLRSDLGAGRFFSDFGAYMSTKVSARTERILGVPPDPADFLAFPTASDELKLAVNSKTDAGEAVQALASLFDISPALLTRQVRHLSGGERSLVALAKAYALSSEYDSLVLANPATWLHPSRRPLVDKVTRAFTVDGKKATILLLQGDWREVDDEPPITPTSADAVAPIAFQLVSDGVEVRFPAAEYPVHTPERRIVYQHEGTALALRSPLLIQGDNGIGKSTLALLLAQVRAPDTERQPRVRVSGIEGGARLILQDTSRQMFAMSASDHSHHTFRYDSERRRKADEAVEALETELGRKLDLLEEGIGEFDNRGRISSMLHSKVTLAVERLMSRPALLILDEPSWGLSTSLARLAVGVIVREAHKLGTPVAIISHETNWLEGIIHSTLELVAAPDGIRVEMRATNV